MNESITEAGILMADFGKYLRGAREARGLSVNQLAMYTGVSASLISRIENGQRGAPKIETLDKLHQALKVSQLELYFMAGHSDVVIKSDPDLDLSDIAMKYITQEELALLKGSSRKSKDAFPPEHTSSEKADFFKRLENELEDTFFYDFHKSTEEQKEEMLETVRMVLELEKKRQAKREGKE